LGEIEIQQEILAKRLARVEAVTLYDVAKGRKPVQCGH
jgi:hypothetical protein